MRDAGRRRYGADHMEIALAPPSLWARGDVIPCRLARAAGVVLLALLLAQRTIWPCDPMSTAPVASSAAATTLEALLARSFCRASLRLAPGGTSTSPGEPPPYGGEQPGDDGASSAGVLLCLHALGRSRARRIRRPSNSPG